ncbi:MAG: carbohydrate kinase [Caldilineae bacterium]|nr:MAG: carbohydrate kinase [Caldilineae bacterium]
MSYSPSPPLILTLDIGTSSARAMLFDAAGRAVPGCRAQTPHTLHTTPGGGATFDPQTLLEGITAAIDRLLAQAGPLATHIGAVGMASLVANLMGVDEADRPVTPLYTYADTRCAPDADRLRRERAAEAEAIHRRTGCPIHSAYLPARFLWLERTRPDALQAAARWVSIGEYLYRQWFGRWGVTYSVASWTGLFDPHTLRWDADWLARLPLDERHLSPLVDADEPFSGLREPWATRWPALRRVPWFPAVGDGAAANIGSGCAGPAQVALTIGTSGAMRVTLTGKPPSPPPGLWLYRLDRRRTLLGGATTEGGNVYRWLRQTLQLPPPDALEAALANMPPAAHGLTILPFLAGERAPGWRDDARAAILGLSLHTRPLDIVRAALEGVAYRFALIHRRLRPHLPAEHRLIAGGGAVLRSPAWRQILADALGCPLVTLAEEEVTARGVALLALEGLGVIADASALPPATGQTHLPNPDHHARYRQAIEAQEEAYRRLV